jgi:hypothetical protein
MRTETSRLDTPIARGIGTSASKSDEVRTAQQRQQAFFQMPRVLGFAFSLLASAFFTNAGFLPRSILLADFKGP